MSAQNAFSPRTVLAIVVVGAGAFLLFLYAIGQGWTGRDSSSGSGHAASNGLNGYSALVSLLEKRGSRVSISRDRGRLSETALLVLTPPLNQDPDALSALLRRRRTEGPTLVVLPKWFASDLGAVPGARPGWVSLGDAISPRWLGDVASFRGTEARLRPTAQWHALGRDGELRARQGQSLHGDGLAAIVTDGRGGALAAFDDDGGYYPTLLPLAGRPVDEKAPRRWALTIVAEPDLVNNLGLAREDRARLAVDLVRAAREQDELPVVFDLTLAGIGGNRNLLTLAFEPPFLAATLCLLLAAVLVAWRALRRFGPPLAEVPELAHGKRQLARNGAGLIERARRLHLLGTPYAALVAARIAARLGLREPHPSQRDEAAARRLAARGIADDYPARLAALRSARKPGELLRAAGALKSIERTLTK